MNDATPTRMRKRRQSKWKSKYCYESPLNVFKRSREELASVAGNFAYNRSKRLPTSRMLRKLSIRNAANASGRESSSRNSVIVINDSDNETYDRDKDDNDNETSSEDASLGIIKCISKRSSPLQQKSQKAKSKISTRKKNIKRLSQDNNSSVIYVSDMQESLLNGENIAPAQTEDDVVELWSCLKNGSNTSEDDKNARCTYDETNAMFVIDKRPNLKYLRCLGADIESLPKKKKKKRDLSCQNATFNLLDESIGQKISKCSNSSRKKRKRDDRSDSSLTESNACRSKRRIISGEENSSTNLTHKLREIIVDGCNVAKAHTNGKEFSEKGIQIVVDYFQSRGHAVKVFLPQHVRKKRYTFLEHLYKEGTVVFTPSRCIDGRRITSYDDRYILKYATACGGIVISSDQYRDLYWEKPEWRNTILNRLLIPTFVGDYIMFPEDPLGKYGPNLEIFLRH